MNSIKYIYNIIMDLRSNASRKFKEEVLATYKDDEHFKRFIYLTMEPSLSYYQSDIKWVEHTNDESMEELSIEKLEKLSKLFSSRDISGNAALGFIDVLMNSFDFESRSLFKWFMLKDLNCGVGISTVNKIWPGLLTKVPYLRFALLKDVKEEDFPWERGVIVQKKHDGQFGAGLVTHNDIKIVTRNGNLYPPKYFQDIYSEIETQLKQYTDEVWRIDGEFVVLEDGKALPREIGNGILNGIVQGTKEFEPNQVPHYNVWDLVELESSMSDGDKFPYENRLFYLNAVFKDCKHITVEKGQIVHSMERVLELAQEAWDRKEEGVMAKHPDMPWKSTSSGTKLGFKVKKAKEMDLRITGFNYGDTNGKYANSLGTIIVISEDGLVQAKVSGGTDAQRDYIMSHQDEFLNQIVVVYANALFSPSAQNSHWDLFLAKTKFEIRTDKDEADTLERIQSIFK